MKLSAALTLLPALVCAKKTLTSTLSTESKVVCNTNLGSSEVHSVPTTTSTTLTRSPTQIVVTSTSAHVKWKTNQQTVTLPKYSTFIVTYIDPILTDEYTLTTTQTKYETSFSSTTVTEVEVERSTSTTTATQYAPTPDQFRPVNETIYDGRPGGSRIDKIPTQYALFGDNAPGVSPAQAGLDTFPPLGCPASVECKVRLAYKVLLTVVVKDKGKNKGKGKAKVTSTTNLPPKTKRSITTLHRHPRLSRLW